MDKTDKLSRDYYVVDLAHIAKVVWQRIWIVAIVSILVAVIGFSISAFVIAPTYSASVMLKVNNSKADGLDFTISSSELTAAQSLAKTYTVILKNRTTLQRVINATGSKYDWEEINDMIESGPVNETEVLRVTVTCEDPYEAANVANGIAEILPQRISEIVEGATMEVVDYAVADTEKVGPSITLFTIIGFAVGALLSTAVLIVVALMDNTVHDDEYVIKTYNYPILAKIPDLLNADAKKYGYYYKNSSSKTNSTGKAQ